MMEDEKGNDGDDGGGDKIDGDNDDGETGGTEPDKRRRDGPNQMKPELEEELCELWDMTMDSVSRL